MRPLARAIVACLFALGWSGLSAQGAAGSLEVRPVVSRAFIIVLENRDYGQVIGNASFPNLNRLARTYGLASNYAGVAHPSLPDYVALISGSTFGSRSDNPLQRFPGPTLVDQMSAKGLAWRGYFEGLPSVGFTGSYAGQPILYAKKHNPFMLFPHLANDAKAAANVRPLSDLKLEVNAPDAPRLAFIVPDLCHDIHGAPSCPITPALNAAGDAFVNDLVVMIQASKAWTPGAAIIITFDEGVGESPHGAGGRVATIVVTRDGPRGVVDDTPYTHYSLLATLEDAWGLTRLREAKTAGVMAPLFAPKK